MRWFVFIMLFFGTSASAQSIDQRKLSDCISEANAILEFADAWRQTLEAKGERPRPWDISTMYRLRDMEQVLRDTFDRLEAKEVHDEILQAVTAAAEPVFLRESLIKSMIEEAYENSDGYEEMAVFVSQCATNYGGELFTLEDEIADLRTELRELKKEKSDIEAQLQVIVADYEQRIKVADDEIRNKELRDNLLEVYKKRNERLCLYAETYLPEAMQEDVIVNNKRYEVCDTN